LFVIFEAGLPIRLSDLQHQDHALSGLSTLDAMSKLRNVAFGSAVLVLALAACQKGTKNEPWFTFASEYAKAHETMMRNEATKKGTALHDLAARDNAAAKLLGVAGPSISELDALLRSNDSTARKVAVVNVMLRQVKDDRLLRSLADTYRIEDDVHTKFFTVQCLTRFDGPQLRALEQSLLNLFSAETDEVVLVAALAVLTRLDKYRTKPLFVRYLRTGGEGLRAGTIISLKQNAPEVFDQIQSELESEGIDIWSGLAERRLPERFETSPKKSETTTGSKAHQ
jgi:hypothetical protein